MSFCENELIYEAMLMTGIASVCPNSLKARRRALKKQRRWKFVQTLWQLLALASFTGGVFWLMTLPYWNLENESQIAIENNQLLSKKQVRQLLSLSYPQVIWKLPPQNLSLKLAATAPIKKAEITRQLFPPKLTVTIEERVPVAKATIAKQAGYLDADGNWIAKAIYTATGEKWTPPTLNVIGFSDNYRLYWQSIYPLIQRSQIKINQVDWRNPNNLVLRTDIGTVYFGSDISDFSQKLERLAQMKRLPSKISLNRLTYIDLSNPSYPTIAVKPIKR